jgi:hypothetical protein
MSSEIDNFCKECEQEFESKEFVFRHLRCHKMSSQEYVLKWKYNNCIPLCSCGCNGKNNWNVSLRDFTRFIHGHHAHGRIKSDEEKAKIGKKNSENMKRWMSKHPDVAFKKGRLMNQATLTPEVQRKKSEAMARFWSSSPFASLLRKEASARAVKLLEAGIIGPHAPFKTEWKFNPFTGQEEFMHSSWETSFLEAAITKGYHVTKSHGITIPYTHPDGSQRTYVPDFYAPEDRTLYEVKGRHDEIDEAKWEAAARFCEKKGWRFEVLFEEQP